MAIDLAVLSSFSLFIKANLFSQLGTKNWKSIQMGSMQNKIQINVIRHLRMNMASSSQTPFANRPCLLCISFLPFILLLLWMLSTSLVKLQMYYQCSQYCLFIFNCINKTRMRQSQIKTRMGNLEKNNLTKTSPSIFNFSYTNNDHSSTYYSAKLISYNNWNTYKTTGWQNELVN